MRLRDLKHNLLYINQALKSNQQTVFEFGRIHWNLQLHVTKSEIFTILKNAASFKNRDVWFLIPVKNVFDPNVEVPFLLKKTE